MVMPIKSLYGDYFQKSRVFLYPLLDIKRGVSITPVETYVSWESYYTTQDYKLICLYHLRDDKEFKDFEKVKLLNNKLFFDYKQVEEDKVAYVFNLDQYQHDFDCFLNGKYSKMSPDHKTRVKYYIGRNDSNLPYIDSFFNPNDYYSIYAELMGINSNLLAEVGELCTTPDLKKENLEIPVYNLEFQEKLV